MQKGSYRQRGVTKSKFSVFLWVFCVAWVLASIFLCCLSLEDTVAGEGRFGLLASGTGDLLIIVFVVWRTAWQVLIDRDARTITFRNLVSKKEIVYPFYELDGFVQVYESRKGGRKVKVVYLVKDRKFCKKLSGSLYSNLDEMEGALAPLQFLGVRKLGLAQRIAIIRNRPVL
jgi:hypothetical protein